MDFVRTIECRGHTVWCWSIALTNISIYKLNWLNYAFFFFVCVCEHVLAMLLANEKLVDNGLLVQFWVHWYDCIDGDGDDGRDSEKCKILLNLFKIICHHSICMWVEKVIIPTTHAIILFTESDFRSDNVNARNIIIKFKYINCDRRPLFIRRNLCNAFYFY